MMHVVPGRRRVSRDYRRPPPGLVQRLRPPRVLRLWSKQMVRYVQKN